VIQQALTQEDVERLIGRLVLEQVKFEKRLKECEKINLELQKHIEEIEKCED